MPCLSWIGKICFYTERAKEKSVIKQDVVGGDIFRPAELGDQSVVNQDAFLADASPPNVEIGNKSPIEQGVISSHTSSLKVELGDRIGDEVLDLGSLFEDDEADDKLRQVLTDLCLLTDFNTLNMGGNTGLTDAGWQIFGEELLQRWAENLQELYIQDCDLTVNQLVVLAPWIKRLTVLKSVYFGYNRHFNRDWINRIMGVDFAERVEIEARDAVFEIRFGGKSALQPTVEEDVMKRNTVQHDIDLIDRIGDGVLDLGSLFEDNEADDKLREVLSDLRSLVDVITLNMGGNTGLTDVGWQIFGEELLHRWAESLQELYIQDCNLTVKKLIALAPWIQKLNALKALEIGCNDDLTTDSIHQIFGADFANRVEIT